MKKKNKKNNKHFCHFVVSDYGVLHNQQCQKYKLYDDEPMDKYFLHYKNGDLHVNDSNEPYNNDGYCIEYQKIGDDIKVIDIDIIFLSKVNENNFFLLSLVDRFHLL